MRGHLKDLPIEVRQRIVDQIVLQNKRHEGPWLIEYLPHLLTNETTKNLALPFTNITNSILDSILEKLVSLETLSLVMCLKLNNFEKITLCRKLKILALPACTNLDDESLSKIAISCNELVHLDINLCHLITNKSVSLVSENCTNLRVLRLKLCNINNIGLLGIASHLQHLQTLDISHHANIGGESIIGKLILGCRFIQDLDLSTVCIDNTTAKNILSGMSKLRSLSLSHTNIGDGAFELLPSKNQAKQNNSQIHNLPLRKLKVKSVSGNLSDHGIELIATLWSSSLVHLDISGNRHITHKCVEYITRLTKLKKFKAHGVPDLTFFADVPLILLPQKVKEHVQKYNSLYETTNSKFLETF